VIQIPPLTNSFNIYTWVRRGSESKKSYALITVLQAPFQVLNGHWVKHQNESLCRTDELVKWHDMSCCYDQNPPALAEALFAFDFTNTFPRETNVRLLASFSSLHPMKLPLNLRTVKPKTLDKPLDRSCELLIFVSQSPRKDTKKVSEEDRN
jgi:hypothetical protein